MAITRRQRRRLPRSAFAIPSRRLYPINTKARALAALRYSARKDTEGSYSQVRRAVTKRYPSLRARTKSGQVSKATKRGKSRGGQRWVGPTGITPRGRPGPNARRR